MGAMPARRSQPPVADAELTVLKALWDGGPATVRELQDRLRGEPAAWAYTTVQTLLQRLEAKSYVRSDRGGTAHVFHPAVSRDRLLRQRLKHLAEQLCEGTATPLVQALVEGHRFTAAEIEHFRRLLDRLEGKG